jgi:hypothetical protein
LAVLGLRHRDTAAHAQPVETKPDAAALVAQLQAQVKHLEGVVPDQAAVMTMVGYHFTNLYFAIDRENWPLADFYLSETQNNIDSGGEGSAGAEGQRGARRGPCRDRRGGEEHPTGGTEAGDRGETESRRDAKV